MTKSINKPTQLHSHLLFSIAQSTQKNQKRVHSNALTKKRKLNEMLSIKELAAYNSTYPIGGVASPLDSFVVAKSSVLRTNFCGKSPPIDNLQNISYTIEHVDAIGFVCGLLSVFLGKRCFPPRSQNYCSRMLRDGYTRIYPDIHGYIRIGSLL
jgi:hypothetical protein